MVFLFKKFFLEVVYYNKEFTAFWIDTASIYLQDLLISCDIIGLKHFLAM